MGAWAADVGHAGPPRPAGGRRRRWQRGDGRRAHGAPPGGGGGDDRLPARPGRAPRPGRGGPPRRAGGHRLRVPRRTGRGPRRRRPLGDRPALRADGARRARCVRTPPAAPIAGSEFEIPCDMVVVAIGTRSNPILTASAPDLAMNEWGYLVTDEHGMTSLPGVFAGGDIVRGAATVILAMGDGKRAAAAIDAYLRGDWPPSAPAADEPEKAARTEARRGRRAGRRCRAGDAPAAIGSRTRRDPPVSHRPGALGTGSRREARQPDRRDDAHARSATITPTHSQRADRALIVVDPLRCRSRVAIAGRSDRGEQRGLGRRELRRRSGPRARAGRQRARVRSRGRSRDPRRRAPIGRRRRAPR